MRTLFTTIVLMAVLLPPLNAQESKKGLKLIFRWHTRQNGV